MDAMGLHATSKRVARLVAALALASVASAVLPPAYPPAELPGTRVQTPPVVTLGAVSAPAVCVSSNRLSAVSLTASATHLEAFTEGHYTKGQGKGTGRFIVVAPTPGLSASDFLDAGVPGGTNPHWHVGAVMAPLLGASAGLRTWV